MKLTKKVLKPRIFKKPDLNKKRFRDTKYAKRLISLELYNKWKKEYPQYADKVKDYESFKRIWRKLMMKYLHYGVHNTMGVRLPFYCGDISIEFINIEYEAVDMTKSVQEGYQVPHLNWNTYDKLAKIIWCVKHAAKFNKYLPFLAFKAHTNFVKAANKALNDKPNIYKTAKT